MNKRYNNKRLNGRPRWIETRVYRVDPESGTATPIHRIPRSADGPHSSDRSYTPFGALEEEIYYEYPSNSIIAIVCGAYHATFDEHHNLTHESFHYEDRSGKKEDKEYTFENEYNGEGRLVRQTGWDKIDKYEHKTVAEFNGSGLMEHKATFLYHKSLKSYDLMREESYEYDGEGRLVRILSTDNRFTDAQRKLASEETREYDSDGALSRKTIRHYDWGETIRISYRNATEYFITIQKSHDEKKIHYRSSRLDDHGNVIAAHLHNVESTLDYGDNLWKTQRRDILRHFDYVYDDHGNWTRHDYYLEGGHYYATRMIEYY